MAMLDRLRSYFPIFEWGSQYDKSTLRDDSIAALIVTVMLIPQSLAYALLAGLPAEVGLYASIAPLLMYTLFGSSRTLAVGPVAVISLMTFTSVSLIAEPGTIGYLETAIALAFLSGLIMVVMGLLKMGFIANFLSHPVISGFISASGILIAFSQLKHVLGISITGHTIPEQLGSLATHISQINGPTAIIGFGTMAFLFFVKSHLKTILTRVNFGAQGADIAVKVAPVIAIIASITATAFLLLHDDGVQIVGAIPSGLPSLSMPMLTLPLINKLMVAAFIISLVGYVESISVAQTLAAKRREKINPNQELIAMGMSNVGSAFSGGFPVTGGFSRSVVNFDAGARTPAAGALTAVGIALATLFLTPFLYYLPKATLAATIIVAVLGLVKIKPILDTYHYSKGDFFAMAATILLTLLVGVETGIAVGVSLSLIIFLHRTTNPHYAVVGQVGESEHFRNVKRHKVRTHPEIISIRIDGSLYFANIRYLENAIAKLISENHKCKHFVLMASAVNFIDISALDALENINFRLGQAGIKLHLSEVKGPVMDRLERSTFLEHLTGKVFLSQSEAFHSLITELNQKEATEDTPAQ